MHNDQIYIARDGKSGMHVLVRILAVDDIGVDYPPIDPDNFNKLMMARDVKSLVLAARNLGPMYISADILSRRTFIPSHLQQDIECGFNLIPPNLESLLSECYFDPYAIPDEIAGIGYRAIGRTGKKATRELINELDFTKAGDLSYLDSQFSIGRITLPGAIARVLMETRSHAALPPMTPRLRFQVWVKEITPPSSSITSFPISRRAISPTDGLNAPVSEAAPDLSPRNSAPAPLCLSQGYKARTSIAR